MQAGGSIAVVWGWILVSVLTFGVGLSLAEICSAYPITGGLYIWVSKLAPPEWVPLMCWLTGWCNWLGLVRTLLYRSCRIHQLITFLFLNRLVCFSFSTLIKHVITL
jgi:amino acid transporter